ncbi:MAG: indolepyruvate oxidoreductase subunit beta [Deltaproteobacteria bacterium]|nr:indolepyruvate oxidoreductase subunit beta [Deltaproteobacteria bacterium]
MENSTKNVLIVGVGGQGVILASNILSEVAMASGFDVKKNEAHGQSQRGGTVPSHVRFGRRVYSPVIGIGEADVVLAFEELEGLRFSHFLRRDGRLILNRQRIYPARVTSGIDRYPEDVASMLREDGIEVVDVDALGVADRLGNPLVVSTVLLGVLSNYLDFSARRWKGVIRKVVPEKHRKINLDAFEAGRVLLRNG